MRSAMSLEVLHCMLMLFRPTAAIKGAKVSPLAGLWIYFSRIKAIFA
jgi:hypothetical protein